MIAKIINYTQTKKIIFEKEFNINKKKILLYECIFCLVILCYTILTKYSFIYMIFIINFIEIICYFLLYLSIKHEASQKYKKKKILFVGQNVYFDENHFLIENDQEKEIMMYHVFYLIRETKKGYFFYFSPKKALYFSKKSITGNIDALSNILKKKKQYKKTDFFY